MSGPAVRVDVGGFGARLRAWRAHHAYSLASSLRRAATRPTSTLLTTLVMAIALALPLGLGLALDNLRRLADGIGDSREIGVFLHVGVDAESAARLATALRGRADVERVELRTPEQGLAEFRASGELAAALALVDGNPLPSVLLVHPRGDPAALVSALEAMPETELVQHDDAWRRRLNAWLAFGQRLVAVLAALLGMGALLVVGNTVRLDLAAREEEIAVMQQLGATDGFIRRPFLYLGLCYGGLAGALALALVALAGMALQPALSALLASYGNAFRVQGLGPGLAIPVLVGAMFLGWLGAWGASGHHLRRTRPVEI